MLVSVILELAVEPAGMDTALGVAAIMKSGGGPDETIVKTTVTTCEIVPTVPVTLTIHLPAGVDEFVKKVSLDEFVPPGESWTVAGLTFHVGHRRQAGGGVVWNMTRPPSPFALVRMMLDTADEPAATDGLLGTVSIVKSGPDV